ncbi:MAG: glycosyltransferase family 2 protein [Candidatus Thalassarchaeaceae archaeon]|nr:glycosyltransferase family 2 protein [Candidatus Thalassarchaeaceae archaeon]
MHPVCVVMPARNESKHIAASIHSIPDSVDWIYVIDDGSTDDTGAIARATLGARGSVLRTEGLGVGGAIAKGSQAVLNLDQREWIVVVMAGDGQMDPSDLTTIIEPIEKKRADHVKGNRFLHPEGANGMPFIRRLGTWLLSILTSLASGRKFGDTQCGYTATSRGMLETWNWTDTWKGYGYPNWWLMEASRLDFKIEEVPVKSIYADEKSGINLFKFLPSVSWMLWKGVWRRGFDWYVTGKKSSRIVRWRACTLWFGSWLTLFLSLNWPLLFVTVPVTFTLLTHLDRKEAHRRKSGGWAA